MRVVSAMANETIIRVFRHWSLRSLAPSLRSAIRKYPSTCYAKPPLEGNRDNKNVNM
jgi:hypothetical protein